jgi:hypothetical protein
MLICYNIIKEKQKKRRDSMWYIFSRSGLRGIETYVSENAAWNAAELRNALANQGWHPVFIKRGE